MPAGRPGRDPNPGVPQPTTPQCQAAARETGLEPFGPGQSTRVLYVLYVLG